MAGRPSKLKEPQRTIAKELRKFGARPARIADLFGVDPEVLLMAVKPHETQTDGEKLELATGQRLLNLLELLEKWRPQLLSHRALPMPLVLPRWLVRQIDYLATQEVSDKLFAGMTFEQIRLLGEESKIIK